jgi:adenylate cyclase
MVKTMPYRILVVDDYEMNLSLMARILELDGYEVMVARSGMEAIHSVMQSMPDLAVLDVMMPLMDGYVLCRELRQPPINATMPVILLTAMNSDNEKQLAKKAGANDILSKPFEMDFFLKRIKELLDGDSSDKKKM